MFALAIYDVEKQELILARDPFGIKPLYIVETKKSVAFASEPAVLTKSGIIEAKLNNKVVPKLLNRQYVGGEETLFEGITRLKPGEVVVIKDGKIAHRKTFSVIMSQEKEIDEENALSEFNSNFNRAVNLHLQSEVPYGAFLSGGVDSSSIVIKMAELETRNTNVHSWFQQ